MPSLVPVDVWDVVGILGFALYVLTYLLLTLRVLTGDHLGYFVLNMMAAGCVLLSLTRDFHLASAMIQVFWITISVLGIAIRVCNPGTQSLLQRIRAQKPAEDYVRRGEHPR